MPPPVLNRGEIWLFDCGPAAKVRPVLILSVPPGPDDRMLVTVVTHTTAVRGATHEVAVPVPFLKPGAFLAQGVSTYLQMRALRRLGALSPGAFAQVETGVKSWLGLS